MSRSWVMVVSGGEEYARVRAGSFLPVAAGRAPLEALRPSDSVLVYLAGEGFVAHARVREIHARGIYLSGIEGFPEPVRHASGLGKTGPAFGLHPERPEPGIVELPGEGYWEVLGAAFGAPPGEESPGGGTGRTGGARGPRGETRGRPRRSRERVSPVPETSETLPGDGLWRLGRVNPAGGHAMKQYRKKTLGWSLAARVAGAVGLGGLERTCGERVEAAERTWGKGGKAEVAVGAELDRLKGKGFAVAHDIAHPRVGNIDHAAVGPSGIFVVETKSQEKKVSVAEPGGRLLLDGHAPQKDFVAQAAREGALLAELLGVHPGLVRPIICFPNGWVKKGTEARREGSPGVRVIGLPWLAEEILAGARVLSDRDVKKLGGQLRKLCQR